MWPPAANMQKKKVMWACKIFCQHRKKKKRKHVSERKTKFLHQQTAYTNHNSKTSWVTTISQHAHRWVVYLWHSISNLTCSRIGYHLARGCFCTSDLYQHLSPFLKSWHQKVVYEVASYILYETRCKYDTPPKLSTSALFRSNNQFLNDTVSWTKM